MSSFHFTSTPPSAQLMRDVQSLSSWPPAALQSFGPVLAAFLGQHRQQEELLAQWVAAQSEEIGQQARPCLASLLHFFTSSMKSSAAGGESVLAAHVHADLLQLGLDEERASLLSAHCLSSLALVADTALANTLQVAQLTDISWKFGVSAAGSELDKMGACFLQLRVNIQRGETKENVLMELSLPQFYQFLQQMQLANRQLQNLSK